MLNNTIMGPVYELSETFEKMDQKDLDFWGLTEYFKIKGDPFGYSPYGYLPDHIQSHWIACRRPLVSSKEFHEYWENMSMIEDYAQAVDKEGMQGGSTAEFRAFIKEKTGKPVVYIK